MVKAMRRFGLAAVLALALTVGLFTPPAHAEDSPNGFCPDSAPSQISWDSGYFPWHSASWGKARVCSNQPTNQKHLLEFQVQDILTDGYCVHVEVLWRGSWWLTTYNSGESTTSCGPIISASSGWFNPEEIQSARLIRGSGSPGVGVNYLTIWTHP